MDIPSDEGSGQYRAEFQELLLYLAVHVVNLNLDKIDSGLTDALQKVVRLIDGDRAYLFQLRAGGETMEKTHEWCAAGIPRDNTPLLKVPVSAFPWSIQKLKRFETIHIARVKDLPIEATAEREELQISGIRSAICVPLVSSGTLIGMLRIESVQKERTWRPEDGASLRIVAELVTNVIQRKKYLEERFQEDLQDKTFSMLGKALSRAVKADEVARAILQAAEQFLRWDACVFELYNSTTDQCEAVLNMDTIRGRKVDVPPLKDPHPTSVVRRAIEEGAFLLMGEQPGFSGLIPFGDKARPSASRMYVPIPSDRGVLAVLSVQSYRENAYTSKELEVLKAIAEYSSGALQRIRNS